MAHASILMVDDDPHVLRSLRAALESHGYRVRSAPNGRDCARVVRGRTT